jgi:hypothetical protein
MKTIALMSLGLLLIGGASADEGWFGQQPETSTDAVGVAAIMAAPEDWEERSLMISGRITDVCTNRGCWAVFEDNGEFLRIMARDHSFALPAEARGPALAHGTLKKVEVSAEHARHLVEDDGADPAVLEKNYEYRLVAEGVRLLPTS